MRESYHNEFKKSNIEQFETIYVKRKIRATSLEEERISKLVNAYSDKHASTLSDNRKYRITTSHHVKTRTSHMEPDRATT